MLRMAKMAFSILFLIFFIWFEMNDRTTIVKLLVESLEHELLWVTVCWIDRTVNWFTGEVQSEEYIDTASSTHSTYSDRIVAPIRTGRSGTGLLDHIGRHLRGHNRRMSWDSCCHLRLWLILATGCDDPDWNRRIHCSSLSTCPLHLFSFENLLFEKKTIFVWKSISIVKQRLSLGNRWHGDKRCSTLIDANQRGNENQWTTWTLLNRRLLR